MPVHHHNKTKIIATIGPATSDADKLKEIIHAGVDVCRLNFSHGSHDVHQTVLERIRAINAELGTHICILQDLQGPKLRIGKVDGESIRLEAGKRIAVTSKPSLSTPELLYVSYDPIGDDVKPGERILLDDGKVELKAIEVTGPDGLIAEVVQGGILTSNKGFNLPDSHLTVPCMTEKDLADLEFGLKNNVEWIALSFVRRPEDIIELKERIAAAGKHCRVIAKIEKPEAVANIEKIVRVADGIMVARGDLGVEVPLQKVPLIQKSIVEKCLVAGKPVIIATQMMESMITNSMPTRAEITDVANAVLDGADAVMLSAETSVGQFPVRVVEVMERIISDVEADRRVYYKGQRPTPESPSFISDEVCFTAVRMSDHLQAKAIVAMTKSGYTGFKVASYRPQASVFIFTNNEALLNTLSLVWGVRGFYYDRFVSTDDTFNDVIDILKQEGMVKEGECVINCASMPIQQKLRTNAIKVSIVN
ncbi:MAG: pyruvate kinase [Bacteroidota bacterium]|jgi:pyruvate kinase